MPIDAGAFPVMKTKKVSVLRKLVKEDAESVLKFLSDEKVMKYYGSEPFKSINDFLSEI